MAIDTLNRFMVGVKGDRVVALALVDKRAMTGVSLTRDEAIALAAWLICMAEIATTAEHSKTHDVREETILEEVGKVIEAIEAT